MMWNEDVEKRRSQGPVRFINRSSLRFLFFWGLVLLLSRPGMAADKGVKCLRIVEKGKSHASIVIPNTASEQLRNAARLLSKYIQQSTGARVPIGIHGASFEKSRVAIHVGMTPYVERLNLPVNEIDEDGFFITFPDEQNIIICGPSDWGAEFGVYEFLESYVGVRWLLPGPDGEHVPEGVTLDVPVKELRQEPAFFSRDLFGLRGKIQHNWARRNRLHRRIEFHHNLFSLFPPGRYTKTHPEFFPVLEGKRYFPPANTTHGWQPCFSACGIAKEATKHICQYFSQNPVATSYSLGVNDGWGYCECSECKAKYASELNFLGYLDASDAYFEWANAVVEGVLKKHPDKWFGCLAYSAVGQPPSKKPVHPRIIPFLTYDRMKWVDEAVELQGKRISEKWAAKSPKLGWYDYIYGTPYCVPRVYFHKMQQYCQYGYSHGVNAFTAEAYPNWGEGPKLYVALKLQWNPNLNVDGLLRDWYICAVGKEAAPYLAAYYDHWECFWTERAIQSKWFTRWGQFLHFYDPSYLDIVTFDDIAKSRRLLEGVVAKTKTEKQQKRAKLLLRAFEYYEASALSYLGLIKNMREPGKKKEYYEAMDKKRYQLVDAFEKDLVLVHPVRFDDKRFRKLNWGNDK